MKDKISFIKQYLQLADLPVITSNAIITSPMGSGKSTTLSKLLTTIPKNKNVLLLNSRIMQCEQYSESLNVNHNKFYRKYKHYNSKNNITISTYDNVKNFNEYNFDFIIVEEYHCLLTDDSFRLKQNDNCTSFLNDRVRLNIPIWLISATPSDEVIESINFTRIPHYIFTKNPQFNVTLCKTSSIDQSLIKYTSLYIKQGYRVIVHFDNKIKSSALVQACINNGWRARHVAANTNNDFDWAEYNLITATSISGSGLSIDDNVASVIITIASNPMINTIQKVGRIRKNICKNIVLIQKRFLRSTSKINVYNENKIPIGWKGLEVSNNVTLNSQITPKDYFDDWRNLLKYFEKEKENVETIKQYWAQAGVNIQSITGEEFNTNIKLGFDEVIMGRHKRNEDLYSALFIDESVRPAFEKYLKTLHRCNSLIKLFNVVHPEFALKEILTEKEVKNTNNLITIIFCLYIKDTNSIIDSKLNPLTYNILHTVKLALSNLQNHKSFEELLTDNGIYCDKQYVKKHEKFFKDIINVFINNDINVRETYFDLNIVGIKDKSINDIIHEHYLNKVGIELTIKESIKYIKTKYNKNISRNALIRKLDNNNILYKNSKDIHSTYFFHLDELFIEQDSTINISNSVRDMRSKLKALGSVL